MTRLTDPLAAYLRGTGLSIPSRRVALQGVRLADREPTLPQESEQSLLRTLANKSMGGLAAVGNLLDIPGSMIRDVASAVGSGDLSRLLSDRNPLDQLLSPISSENRVSGRDLLTEFGMRPNVESGISGWFGDPGEAARDIAGFGAEVLLDPFFFATGPTKAAIKAIGVNPLTRAVGRGIASTQPGAALVEAGGQVGRGIGALFDRSVRGATTAPGRVLGRAAHAAEREAAVTAGEAFAPHIETFGRYLNQLPDTPTRIAVHDVVRDVLEDWTGKKALPPELQGLQSTVDAVRKLRDEMIPRERAAGVVSKDVDDLYADYVTRRAMRFAGDKSSPDFLSRLLSGAHSSQKHRKEFLRDIQGGTRVINRLSVDQRFSGVAHKLPPAKVNKKFWQDQEKALQSAFDDLGAPNLLFEEKGQLVRWLANLDPRHVSEGVPIFPHNPIEELALRQAMGERAMALGGVIRNYLKPSPTAGRAFFHGTRARVTDISKIDPGLARATPIYGPGLYLTDNASIAKGYSTTKPPRGTTGEAQVFETIVPDDMKLLDLEQATSDESVVKIIGQFLDEAGVGNTTRRLLSEGAVTPREALDVGRSSFEKAIRAGQETAESLDYSLAGVNERLAELGYEGLKHKGGGVVGDTPHQVAIVFENARQKLMSPAKSKAVSLESAGPDTVPLKDVLDAANLDVKKSLGLLGAKATDRVPKELADDIGRVIKTFRAPDEVGKLLASTDAFTRLWKAGMTSFPAFHARNLLSGQVANVLAGAWSPSSFANVWRLIRGKPMQGLQDLGPEFKGLSDEAATRLFAQQAFADRVAPKGQGIGLEDVGVGSSLDRSLAADIPGLQPFSVRASLQEAIPRTLQEADPTAIAGVRTQTDVFAPVRSSRQFGHATESLNRIVPYLTLRRKAAKAGTVGRDARREATARANAIQVDYENLSEFERNVMRRVIPFYSFTRGQAEFLAKELMARPGGPFGQAIRVQGLGVPEDQPLPEHIGQTSPIPWETLPDGTQRFITGLGLMHEDPLSFLGGGNIGSIGLEAASRLHPIPKGAIEAITGESFFQRGPLGGRELLDMDPTIGRLLTNVGLQEESPGGRAKPFIGPGVEHFLSNMPTSRLMTTLRTATDPRKYEGGTIFPGEAAAMNLLTGIKASDLSPAAADRALRDQLGALGREDLEGRLFQSVYIPQDVIDETRKTDPEAAQRMENVRAMQNLVNRRSRQRAKAKEVEEQRARWTQTAP